MKLMSPITKMLHALLSRRKFDANAMSWYVRSYPDPESALAIFRGDWVSKLPAPYDGLGGGTASLFTDERIEWFAKEVGGVAGMSAVELGPLEGGHAYMLEKLGASSVVSIEANTKAYLKCLIVKELFELQRVRFKCGDFLEYLRREDSGPFDICVASGVMYHMENPIELIELLARRCTRHILLWTHYYDEARIAKAPILAAKFSTAKRATQGGFEHTLHRKEYGATMYWSGFCGGPSPICNWVPRQDILNALSFFGFSNLKINFERPDHPNGPSFAVIASKL